MKKNREKMGLAGPILWIILLVVMALIAFLVVSKKAGKPVETPAEKAVPVRVVTLRRQALPDVIVLPGRIEPLFEVDLSAEKPGRIVKVAVEKGATVKAGQLLLEIDSRKWEAQKRRADVERRDAATELVRWEELKKTGAVSDSDFEKIKRRKNLADIACDEADVSISQCRIVSPLAGIVDERLVEEGEYIQEGNGAFKIVNIDRVKVSFDVPEQDVLSVQEGQDVPFRPAMFSEYAFTGRVSFVSVLASPASNSFHVEMLSANAEKGLKPGMLVDVRLVRKIREDAIAIPLSAVIPRKGDYVVFVAQERRAVRRVVRIDAIIGHDVVILSGLTAGEALVVAGHRALRDGTFVEIVQENASR